MDGADAVVSRLDIEFDQLLVDMKPFILKLPHKSERQKCALWIKKFCEPPITGITGRKNRNMYAQLLLHMLKRGVIEGPFTEKPESGPLPTLPAYMSIYFDDLRHSPIQNNDNRVPDWVAGELASELTGLSSIHSELPSSFNTDFSASRFPSASERSPLRKSVGFRRDRSPSPPRTRGYEDDRVPPFNLDNATRPPPATVYPLLDDTATTNGEDFSRRKTGALKKHASEGDWKNTGFDSTFMTTRSSALKDEASTAKLADRELEMRTKMLEAKFQEDKLRLQQKHDSTVQKILDRKNSEIEEIKSHYRSKAKENEDALGKLEKKVHQQQKELAHVRETKDKQIAELKKLSEESTQTKQNQMEKKLHDAMADFEQEKFEMQKQHTKNIQELLDDTNSRLQKMEDEYNQQMQATTALIKELESRVHQLTSEAEILQKLKSLAEAEKADLAGQIEKMQADLIDHQSKFSTLEKEQQRSHEEHHQEIRSLKNKHEANLEFLKQEQSLNSVKSADSIADLEQHVAQMKHALEHSEHQQQKQTREMEQMHLEDKAHLEHLHDKKVKCLQKEIDQLELDSQRKIRQLEQSNREKDDDMMKLKELLRQQDENSKRMLEDVKAQVDRNSAKLSKDMRHQMDKVESDLNRSKQLREKQVKEFQRQLDDERKKHEQKIVDLKLAWEQEKFQLLQDQSAEKELLNANKEQEVENLRDTLRNDLLDADAKTKEKMQQASKTIKQLEKQVQTLREEVMQGNQLRKQQLVELGLLREEEKQKIQRDSEAKISKLRSEMEQQRLELEKEHSTELEQVLEKTNGRLKEIEKDYLARSSKTTETMNELERTNQQLRDDISRQQEQYEARINQTTAKYEEEKKKYKEQQATTMMSAQHGLESHKNKTKQLERKLTQQEQDYEERLTSIRSQYEDRMHGLIPVTVRQELEDTISALRSQVKSVEQRAAVLQEELDCQNKFTLNHLGSSLGSVPAIKPT